MLHILHPKVSFNEIWNMCGKVFFVKIAVLNIFGIFLGKHQLTELIFSIVMAFCTVP